MYHNLKIGSWNPDREIQESGKVSVIQNLIPNVEGGFVAHPSSKVFDGIPPLPKQFCSGFQIRDQRICGTENGLYLLKNNRWINLLDRVEIKKQSRSSPTSRWKNALWGDNIIFVHPDYPVLIYDHRDGKITPLIQNQFCPRAHYVATNQDFVFLGNLLCGQDQHYQSAIAWSKLGDASSFDPNLRDLSDCLTLPIQFGQIQHIVGGKRPIIFQKTAIFGMSFHGAPLGWNFAPITTEHGCITPGSVVKFYDHCFFLDRTGFMALSDGKLRAIGQEKINQYFWSQVNLARLDEISSGFNVNKQRIYWSYPSLLAPSGVCDQILVYDIASDQWGLLVMDHAAITTMDELSIITTKQELANFSGPALKGKLQIEPLRFGNTSLGLISELQLCGKGEQFNAEISGDVSPKWSGISLNFNKPHGLRSLGYHHCLNLMLSSHFENIQELRFKWRKMGR